VSEDRGGWLAFLIAAIVVAACVLALCGCKKVVPTDHAARAHGMPLDACEVVEYDRPIWLPDCNHAYKVYDRQTGSAWWLLDMGQGSKSATSYIVLPLDEADR
jgi:hypothetical protein